MLWKVTVKKEQFNGEEVKTYSAVLNDYEKARDLFNRFGSWLYEMEGISIQSYNVGLERID